MKILKTLGLATGLATSLLFASSTAGFAQECDPGEIVIKFSHVTAAAGHPKGEFAAALATRINAEMQGVACMEVFPNSTLFDDNKVMEALLLGDVQIAAPSLSKFESFTLKYRLFDLPFLFPNMDAVNKFTQGPVGQELLNAVNDKGYVGLGYVYNGLKSFSANKPLILPSDAAGLRFRTQTSDVAVAMIEAMGASAQKLAFSEVYGALQTGVVDGQENTWSNIFSKKFFEVQDGVTETNHQLLTYLAITSKEWLDSLDADVRDQFLTIFKEEINTANGKATALNAVARQNVIDAGGVVRTLTDEQRQVWVDTMKPVWAQFADDIGQENIDAAVAAGM
jgi:C4-dicarboxylate-binding protein DctP